MLFALLAGMAGSLLLGMIHGLHVMLIVNVVLDLLFVAYIVLLIRMRNLAAEREMKVTFLPGAAPARGFPAGALAAQARRPGRRLRGWSRLRAPCGLLVPARHACSRNGRARRRRWPPGRGPGVEPAPGRPGRVGRPDPNQARRGQRGLGSGVSARAGAPFAPRGAPSDAVHRQQPERVSALLAEAHDALRQAQEAVRPYPAVAFAGFLHDAEKEYAEAVLTGVLIRGDAIPSSDDIGVELPAWLNGLAEAASELRRHLLDRLRAGQLGVAEELLVAMEDVYDLVVSVDYPDAVTGGLRRTADALRAVLERTRSDLTITLLQARLEAALDRRLDAAGDG